MNETLQNLRKHKLLPQEIVRQLPAIMSQDGKGDEGIVYVKYFCPYSSAGPWYIMEYDPENHMAFGLVAGDYDLEYGSIYLPELEACTVFGTIPAVERDCGWKPRTVAEVKKLHPTRAA